MCVVRVWCFQCASDIVWTGRWGGAGTTIIIVTESVIADSPFLSFTDRSTAAQRSITSDSVDTVTWCFKVHRRHGVKCADCLLAWLLSCILDVFSWVFFHVRLN